MIVSIPYHPSRPQRLFHESRSDEIFYGGEVGGGKTAAIVMDALKLGLQYKGVTLYIFRATYQQGVDTILEKMKMLYPKDGLIGRMNKQDMAYEINNGSKIRIRQCKTLADAEKNDSKEFSVLYVDEVEHLVFAVYDYLCTRVRANKALGIKPQVKLGGMQGGKGHAWINRTFVKPLEPNVPKLTLVKSQRTGEEYETAREFIPASITDNKHIDDRYAARLEQRSDKLKKRLLSHDWNAIEGQSFPEWVDKPFDDNGKPTDRWTHVVKAFEIPANWPIYRGYDYGRSKPYAFGWFARSDERYNNRLFMIHELYGGKEDESGLDEPASKQAMKALKVELPLREKHGYITGVADPSIFGKTPYADETIASMMSPQYDENGIMIRDGLEFLDPRFDKTVAQNVINHRLQGKELIHEALIFDANGHPGFQVFDTCVKFRQHFPELVADPKNPDDVDSDQADHDYDEFRYVIVLTKPKIQTAPAPSQKYRPDPLGMAKREHDEDNSDYGKVIQIPQIIVGG